MRVTKQQKLDGMAILYRARLYLAEGYYLGGGHSPKWLSDAHREAFALINEIMRSN